ncbi:PD-(D/E)XK motif protein [Nocardia sp. NPDC051321]|uniref:PD-(D/E)XK motif protein n=1 Tax=Nocardia sp. NPDC051321 TaxID=3364323 RepID=UPI0037BBAAB8
MGLRVAYSSSERPPDTRLENVSTRTTLKGDSTFLEVVIDDPSLFRDAYGPLCSMADRIQIEKMTVTAALRITLENLNALLREVPTMTVEREIALVGELLTVRGILAIFGRSVAANSWRGGAAEHDFGFPELDVEVKTTSTERRMHWISSLTQLVPTTNRPLWLVSHQLTEAGPDSGARLPELIRDSRAAIGEGAPREALERGLRYAGWADRFADECLTRWVRRGRSLAWPVTGNFPRLVPEMIVASGGDLARLPDVRYRIDLTGYSSDGPLPTEVAAAIANERD